MAEGPGKYDGLATYVREQSEAEAVVVVIVHGNLGSGFSVHVREDKQLNLAALLRVVADQLEADAEGEVGPLTC